MRRIRASAWFCNLEVEGVPYEVGAILIGGDITPTARVHGMVSYCWAGVGPPPRRTHETRWDTDSVGLRRAGPQWSCGGPRNSDGVPAARPQGHPVVEKGSQTSLRHRRPSLSETPVRRHFSVPCTQNPILTSRGNPAPELSH